MPELTPYTFHVLAAYGATFLILALIILSTLHEARKVNRAIGNLKHQ